MFAMEIWGPRALFTKIWSPGTEKTSYDFITPMAARGIIESVYWHPGIRFVIDEIRVLNPIRFRQETIIPKDSLCHGWLESEEEAEKKPFTANILVDVRYLITAHFNFTQNKKSLRSPGKVMEILQKRSEQQKPFRPPCLGSRELPCSFKWVEENEIHKYQPVPITRDFGLMPYDMEYRNQNRIPIWYRAKLKNGVVNLRDITVLKNGEEVIVNTHRMKG